VLWSSGETLILAGPTGVGKTTVAHQLVLALVGLRHEVLGFPVQSAGGKVLLVCADRPSQARKAMRRCVQPSQRAILADRVVIYPGPLSFDIAAEPLALVELARELGASHVVVDSLKDVARDLSNEAVGTGVARALGACAASGIEICVLHHQRKATS